MGPQSPRDSMYTPLDCGCGLIFLRQRTLVVAIELFPDAHFEIFSLPIKPLEGRHISSSAYHEILRRPPCTSCTYDHLLWASLSRVAHVERAAGPRGTRSRRRVQRQLPPSSRRPPPPQDPGDPRDQADEHGHCDQRRAPGRNDHRPERDPSWRGRGVRQRLPLLHGSPARVWRPPRIQHTDLRARFAGFAIGYAATGGTTVTEIEFADYIFPAFDQIANEAAKFRYRSGGGFDCGKLTFRAPYGAVGGGGHYHSQSPEAYFTHTPGLKVVIPHNPTKAKGLLLAAIRDPNPVLFFEPKALYEASVGDVPLGEYTERLGEAEVVREGSEVTVLGWGAQMRACNIAEEVGINCELIDLLTIFLWDVATIEKSVNKTGRLVISHEVLKSGGFVAEIASTIQERCFRSLTAPIQRVCGYDTPFPLTLEKFYPPDMLKNLDAIKRAVKF